MLPVIKLALKDIKLMLRDRLGAFFIIGFPILMGLFFGLVMGGPSSGDRGKMKLAIIDHDQSQYSTYFLDALHQNDNIVLEPTTLEDGRQSVRKGQRLGFIVVPENFGDTAGVMWETPPTLQLGMDPSRSAESAMVQGFVMEAMGGLISKRFGDPENFRPMVADTLNQVKGSTELGFLQKQTLTTLFGSLDELLDSLEQLQNDDGNAEGSNSERDSSNNMPGFQLADIENVDISRTIDPNSPAGQFKKLRSKWDISFPQAMMWGVLACCAGFAISIAREKTMGTMLRLKAAPIRTDQILAGKALACFLTVIGVITFMIILGVSVGMNPASYAMLTLAAGCVSFCFVGIMMVLSVLGKSEQSVNGIGWAICMVMAMFGGGMIPVMFMPAFMQKLSVISPVKWSILALEGAVWREFSIIEMGLPCGILVAIGLAGMIIGTTILQRR